MSWPSLLSIATPSTSSPSASSTARSLRSPPTRAATTLGSSAKSSQALVPVVTARSARSPASMTVTLISDTGVLLYVGGGRLDRIGRVRGVSQPLSLLGVLGRRLVPLASLRAPQGLHLRLEDVPLPLDQLLERALVEPLDLGVVAVVVGLDHLERPHPRERVAPEHRGVERV